MFKRILIANRGEIACRVIDTCRRMGVQTVAVYSDADRHARHVRHADQAVHIGGAAPADSYLNIDHVVQAACDSGSEAIHPGYGFLSENAEFARACPRAGLAFIGPGADTIDQMGSKSAAKTLMESAGVPTVPGYHGKEQSDASLIEFASEVGYPVLIKASAGGGGKGMRIAHDADGMSAALAGARREARSAFGDDQLLVEKFLIEPRHVEVQIIADTHGNVLHLFERECSIQRRYQKVIEESPSPFLDDALRDRMYTAAVDAAHAVDYVNAGTVEFIVDRQRNFYFMEMNTRLQVEHPVTEMITGVDLVDWQLRVAAGEALPATQQQLTRTGHAIEARVYAEDPYNNFLPSTGLIRALRKPEIESAVRWDGGVEAGDAVTIHYDPMVAKLIVFGPDRSSAIHKLAKSLAQTAVIGPTTNLPLLNQIAVHPDFEAGSMHTAYLDRNLDAVLTSSPELPRAVLAAAGAAQLYCGAAGPPTGSPWAACDGWRLSESGGRRLSWRDAAGNHGEFTVARHRDAGYVLEVDGRKERFEARAMTSARGLYVSGAWGSVPVGLLQEGDELRLSLGRHGYALTLQDLYPAPDSDADDDTHPGSPMPGRIVQLLVAPGDRVRRDQPLLVVEGMKMEYTLRARVPGKVENVLYAAGDTVEAETPLIDILPDHVPETGRKPGAAPDNQ